MHSSEVALSDSERFQKSLVKFVAKYVLLKQEAVWMLTVMGGQAWRERQPLDGIRDLNAVTSLDT